MTSDNSFRTLILSVVLIAACSQDEQRADAVARDTVVTHRGGDVTVSIVESPAPSASLARWRIDDSASVVLGAVSADPDAALFRVAGAYRLSDGRFAVADGGSSQIKVFDETADVVQTIGGAGEGPGEFQRMMHFAVLRGDTLLVWDMGQARLTLFDPDGTIVREVRVGAEPGSRRSSIAGVFADGTMLAQGFVDLGGHIPEGLERHVAAIYRLGADGALLDSIGSVAGGEGYFVSFDRGFTVFQPPFARTSVVVASGERIYIGDSETAEIRVLAADGTPRQVIRWSDPARTIGAREIGRAREHALASVDASRHTDVERMFADLPMPTAMPAFSAVRVDDDGRIWVQRYRAEWDEGPATWLVFDSEGELAATIDLPPRLSPTDIGTDYVLGVERDDLDLETVRLYRLHRD